MKIKLVKFKDGKFAIRRGSWFTNIIGLGYEFLDLDYEYSIHTLWLRRYNTYFKNSCRKSEEIARKQLSIMQKTNYESWFDSSDCGKVIKCQNIKSK